MKTKDIARQRAKIGMVFQRFNLFPHRTALENVMEGPMHVKRDARVLKPSARPLPCCVRSASARSSTRTRRSSQVGSNSA